MDIIIYIFLVTVGLFEKKITFLGYWDEFSLAVGIVLFFYTFSVNKMKLKKNELFNIMLVTLLIVIGLTGNIFHPGLQDRKIAVIKDIVAFIKFPVLLISMRTYMSQQSKPMYINWVWLSKLITATWLVFAIVGYVFDIGVYLNDETRLLKTFEFYYTNCIYFAAVCVMTCCILISDSAKKNRNWIIADAVLLFMTQRSKIIFVSFLIIAFIYIKKHFILKAFKISNIGMVIRKKYFVIAGFLMIITGWFLMKDRIMYYWQWGLASARNALYIVGIDLAKEYFPIGSGFGTFASFTSGEYYSKVYYNYGIDTVLGLSPAAYNYVSDTFWPYIYGQLGIIGCVIYIVLMVRLFKQGLLKIASYDGLLSYLIIWIYSIVQSLGEAFYTNSSAVVMVLILTLYIENSYKKGDLANIDGKKQYMRFNYNTSL